MWHFHTIRYGFAMHLPLPSLRSLSGLAALLALAGCAAVPDLGPKPAPIAPAEVAADQSLASQVAGGWPAEDWWQGYGDPQLTALIEEGLRNSPDVAAATARYRRASGLARQAGAAMLPSLDVQGDASLEKQSYNNGFPREFLPQGWQDTGQLAGAFNFDLDLWGRNRAGLAAAASEQRAAAVEARQARLMLATGIASAYADLARLHVERDIRAAELEGYIETQHLIRDRNANGLETRGTLRQADAEVANARVALNAGEEAIALRRNQIAALIGAGPDRGLAIIRPKLPEAGPGGLPADVTTNLVGRRPDVVAARERVEAAASRIRVARADFFPALRLSALFGVQSLGLENLFKSGSDFGSVGPAFTLPVFHGGELQGRYRVSRADYDAAVADYDRTVLGAYQQVADAVTISRKVNERLADARSALAASEDAYKVARLRYEGGLSNYLDVLVVHDRLLQVRLAVAGLEGAARSADIALIRALGGGFAGEGDASKDNSHG